MTRLTVTIAGVTVELTLPEGPVADELVRAWAHFQTSNLPRYRVFTESSQQAPHLGLRAMPSATENTLTGEDFLAQLQGESVRLSCSAQVRFPFDATLKWLLARELAEHGGLLLHGVALGPSSAAALFVAESGAGKSTLGELRNSQLMLLSDELVALTADLRLHGTPWNVGTPRSFPAVLLGTLGWSDEPRFEPVAPSELVPLFLGNTLLPDESAAARSRAFHAVSRALSAVETVRFFFSPDSRSADSLLARLSG